MNESWDDTPGDPHPIGRIRWQEEWVFFSFFWIPQLLRPIWYQPTREPEAYPHVRPVLGRRLLQGVLQFFVHTELSEVRFFHFYPVPRVLFSGTSSAKIPGALHQLPALVFVLLHNFASFYNTACSAQSSCPSLTSSLQSQIHQPFSFRST